MKKKPYLQDGKNLNVSQASKFSVRRATLGQEKENSTASLNYQQFDTETTGEELLNMAAEATTITTGRGSMCYYAHGEGELVRAKQGSHFTTWPAWEEELQRKIFVGGLPPSVDSDMLGEFFEEQFGAVEDAIVIGSQPGDHIQSRGFGFVTFRDKQSVAAAIQAHYIFLMGKQVEIKVAVPKSVLLAELGQQQQQDHLISHQVLTPMDMNANDRRSEKPMSWLERLIRVQQNDSLSELQGKVIDISASGDENLPPWVTTFRKWLPGFLQEVSKRLKEGEWYPLSSLKGDFRATCGLELDHASLGYLKLSDFMRSFPGICRMKVVPVGGRGAASHMVLLPYPSKSMKHQLSPVTGPTRAYSFSPPLPDDDEEEDDIIFLKGLQSASYANFCHSSQGGGPSVGAEVKKSDTPSIDPRFLTFLQPNPLFYSLPWRHVLLQALPERKGNTSSFFVKWPEFHKNYEESKSLGKCFGCDKGKMLWSNSPCGHLLWCNSCKGWAEKLTKDNPSDHKCVICDMEVKKMQFQWQKCGQACDDTHRDEEFPSWDPNVALSNHKRNGPFNFSSKENAERLSRENTRANTDWNPILPRREVKGFDEGIGRAEDERIFIKLPLLMPTANASKEIMAI
uniref:RRM domain-containing protein n=1 Tax=Nelumbo nucifera TaxID=4432 RepID=A0A822YLI0_NELNU|nr:TPA_asm: hypothetical protein HUJ06_005674 [Nelumbo nucifera]